jgi:hypothetical protein
MAQTDTRSLQQIKRETEQTRAGLTKTVDELRASMVETTSDIRRRISPDAIKTELSSYIRSRGERLTEDLTTAARRNPMQAVAVGASLAYPLLRLVRSIPVPLLMVGAGLFFAGSKTGQSVTQQASDTVSDLSDDVGRRARGFRDQVGASAVAAKTFASQALDRMTDAVSGGADQVSQAADAAGATLASGSEALQDRAASVGVSIGSRADDLKNQGVRMARSAADAVQGIASGASSVARDTVAMTADAGLNSAKAVRDTASQLTDGAGKTVRKTIEQNPLVVAGMGLLIGGLIASALPRSDIEDDLVGNASRAVKRGARAAASQGLDAARGVVGEMFDETARRAEAEGLTVDGMGKAAQDVGQRIRRVAESAVTTAFDPAKNDHQSNAHGDIDHD